METLNSLFSGIISEALASFSAPSRITGDNVYQQADAKALTLVDRMVERLALPGSGISGIGHLSALLEKARAGSACLLLLEHYSNLDLPNFSYLLRKEGPAGAEVNDALLAIAGMKLNEENPAVAVFSSAYTRIVICPSRSASGGTEPEHAETEHAGTEQSETERAEHERAEHEHAERLRMISINRAAMRKLEELKRTGRLVLIFPSGTRYRPWDPTSKRGVREIDSYIKTFDYMCFAALNGEVMHVRQGDMLDDFVSEDVLRFTVSPPCSCADFRREAREAADKAGAEDKKQAVADAIMARLDAMHNEAEKERLCRPYLQVNI
jgi:glycerol-3-phosphate O-acyltransferase